MMAIHVVGCNVNSGKALPRATGKEWDTALLHGALKATEPVHISAHFQNGQGNKVSACFLRE